MVSFGFAPLSKIVHLLTPGRVLIPGLVVTVGHAVLHITLNIEVCLGYIALYQSLMVNLPENILPCQP